MAKLPDAAIASLDGRAERGRVLPDASDGIQREDVMNPC
jgi:hypothetical protein